MRAYGSYSGCCTLPSFLGFGVTDQWPGSPSSVVREEDKHELNGVVIAQEKFLNKEEDGEEEPRKSTALDT
jgi:hypothetical protein